MKTLKIFSIAVLAISLSYSSFAQTKTESFKVSGECGMCKKKIEKSAKEAGATYASWNQHTKTLTVKYDSRSSNAARIQEKIAATGYDTPQFKATDEAYKSLEECCQYDRTAAKDSKKEDCGKDCARDCKDKEKDVKKN